MNLNPSESDMDEFLYVPSDIFSGSEDLAELFGRSDFTFIFNDIDTEDITDDTNENFKALLHYEGVQFGQSIEAELEAIATQNRPVKPRKKPSKREPKESNWNIVLTESDKCIILEQIVYSDIEMELMVIDNQLQFKLVGEGTGTFPIHYMTSLVPNATITSQKVENIEKVTIADQLKLKMPCFIGSLGMKIWICPLQECDKCYCRFAEARLHALIHLGYKPYKCSVPDCEWAFYNLSKLQRHEDTHKKRKDFFCTETGCNRSFTTVYNLKCHLRTHAQPANFPCLCTNCPENFSSAKNRDNHLKTHGEAGAMHICNHPGCKKRFYFAPALTAHKRSHSHNKELRCSFEGCNKVFEQPCRLKQHEMLHTDHKPFICDVSSCKWAFRTSSKLRRHIHTHTNLRKFRCTIGDCDKSFSRSEHLKEHTISHIGQKSPQREEATITLEIQNEQEELGNELPSQELILRQAIQSLENSSDMLLDTTIFDIDPPILLETDTFSTVNLRDLE